jgi:three-Cys-motif partner protein
VGENVSDPYRDREQTKTKHFLLKHYLQALAFKVLRYFDLTYIDGFSGPWKTETEDFADSSFMIAISVLKDAQEQILRQTGRRPRVRCFFSENNRAAFTKLAAAVAAHNRPEEVFEIKTFFGDFENAIGEIEQFIGRSFALIFIDPTGWTGYPFEKIKSLLDRPRREVLINFMYDFVNRAAAMSDEKTVASLDQILGGPRWEDRLDTALSRGKAVEKLFRDALRQAGNFEYIVSTKIDRPTADRPHFFIVYGTNSDNGLEAFREIEYRALRGQARDRANAKDRRREERIGAKDLFFGVDADFREASIDDIVAEQKQLATEELLRTIEDFEVPFGWLWPLLLEKYLLRVTNIKDICVDLAKVGTIENTWGGNRRKPKDSDPIKKAN